MTKTTDDAIRPTPQRLRHDDVLIPAIDRDHPTPRPGKVVSQTILDRYRAHRILTESQVNALEIYQFDWYLSGRGQRVTSSYGGRSSPSHGDQSNMQISAGQRRDRTIMALDRQNPIWAPVVEAVTVDDMAVGSGGLVNLRLAADFLHKYYGR